MIVQNLVPILGNIPIGPLSITLIHITVIVAAIVLGPVQGMIVGGIWGMITFIRAFILADKSAGSYLLYESADFGSSANLSRGGCRLWFFMDEKTRLRAEVNGDCGHGRKYDQYLAGSWPDLSFLSQSGTAIVCGRCSSTASVFAGGRGTNGIRKCY